MFSGEPKFTLNGSDCNQSYWDPVDDAQQIHFRPHSGGSNVVVWVCFRVCFLGLWFLMIERRTHSVTAEFWNSTFYLTLSVRLREIVFSVR